MKHHHKIALTLVSAAVIAGRIHAQPAAPPSTSQPEQKAPEPKLSPEAMTREAQALRERVRGDIQWVLHLQAKARRANDIIKLTCVNDKLVRLKAEANLFDEAHRALLLSLDSNARFPAYERVATSASAVQGMREEANGCIGEPELNAESANDFTQPEIPDDPTLGLPFDIELEPPAYASPYN